MLEQQGLPVPQAQLVVKGRLVDQGPQGVKVQPVLRVRPVRPALEEVLVQLVLQDLRDLQALQALRDHKGPLVSRGPLDLPVVQGRWELRELHLP